MPVVGYSFRCHLPKGSLAVPIRPILRYPHPGLKTVCAPVMSFDSALSGLADDLLQTMRAAPGVGITAAHIGVFERLTVLELDKADGVRIYVNPDITWFSDETMIHMEGSVSMPGATDEVTRPKAIRFHYQDLQGHHHEEEASDFRAICVQHEVDQLDGVFWLQRLSRLKRDRLIKKWDRMKS
jgi:peptide deformylase